jgi:hypothetical protein
MSKADVLSTRTIDSSVVRELFVWFFEGVGAQVLASLPPIIDSPRAAKAASDLEFLPILDMRSPLQPSIGWDRMQYTIGAEGSPQSSFRSYLPQTFVTQSVANLHICIRAMTDGRLHADFVEVQSIDRRVLRVIEAKREIFLTYGAFGTPKVLLLRLVRLPTAATAEHKDPFNPNNRLDFPVMAVRSILLSIDTSSHEVRYGAP